MHPVATTRAIKYGMGGWTDNSRSEDRGGPLRTKVVFLNESRDFKPENCFIIAIELITGNCQIRVQGHEKNDSVFRVYRSAVPEAMQKSITLRELINIKEQSVKGWWHF